MPGGGRGADLDFDLLGHLLADGHVVGFFHVADDRLIEIVAGDADGFADADVGQGDDRDFRRAAADVDDHAGGGFGDRKPRADGGGHGLFDQIHPPCPGALGAVVHGAPLDGGDSRWDRDDHARADEMLSAMHPADEIGEHRLGDFEIADDAILQRADRGDRAGRFAEHFLGDQADGVAVLQDAVGPLFDGNDAGLIEDDAFAFDADQRVARAQVDAHVDAEHAKERIEDHAVVS